MKRHNKCKVIKGAAKHPTDCQRSVRLRRKDLAMGPVTWLASLVLSQVLGFADSNNQNTPADCEELSWANAKLSYEYKKHIQTQTGSVGIECSNLAAFTAKLLKSELRFRSLPWQLLRPERHCKPRETNATWNSTRSRNLHEGELN